MSLGDSFSMLEEQPNNSIVKQQKAYLTKIGKGAVAPTTYAAAASSGGNKMTKAEWKLKCEKMWESVEADKDSASGKEAMATLRVLLSMAQDF